MGFGGMDRGLATFRDNNGFSLYPFHNLFPHFFRTYAFRLLEWTTSLASRVHEGRHVICLSSQQG